MIKGNDNIERKPYLGQTEIAEVWLGNVKVYPDEGIEPPVPGDYSTQYLTFEALEDGAFTFTPLNNNVIRYSTDDGTTWTAANTVQVSNGDKVLFKGNMTPIKDTVNDIYGIGTFSSTGQFNVEGNIMSLLFGDRFRGKTSLEGYDDAFSYLFRHTNVISAENLILPATTLSDECYFGMFHQCYRLVGTPELPATQLTYRCYANMFRDCQSLAYAIDLPAYIMAERCYEAMFMGCISLTSVPAVLPSETLEPYCYAAMFSVCESLVTAPELPSYFLAEGCYQLMFNGCTSLTIAPVLQSDVLVTNCYYQMFEDCSNLQEITCLATNISATNCTYNWVNGVPSDGIFKKSQKMFNWTYGANGIPRRWTVLNV